MSLERRRRLVEIARERELLVLEDNPYGLLRYEGEPLPTLLRARRRRVRHLPRHVLEDPLARAAARLGRGAAAGAGEDEPRQAGRRPLLVVVAQHFVGDVLRARATGAVLLDSLRGIYRRRRDVMLDALEEHFPAEATWTRPQGGLFIWATLPDYIDTTDLLARALRENVAFVPGPRRVPRRPRRLVDAAELLRRRRGRHPRGRPPHRQGRRRAGRALRHAHRRRARAGRAAAPTRRGRGSATRARGSSRCAARAGGER